MKLSFSILLTVMILNLPSADGSGFDSPGGDGIPPNAEVQVRDVEDLPVESTSEPEIDFGDTCTNYTGDLGITTDGPERYFIRAYKADGSYGDNFELKGKDKDIKTLVGNLTKGTRIKICAKPVPKKPKVLSVETLEEGCVGDCAGT